MLNTILSPNGIIFVEEVTYMTALDAFRQFPLMKIVADEFEKMIVEEKRNGNFLTNEQKIFWAMFYTIPTSHNPTGSTLPPDKLQLIRLIKIY